MDEVQPDWVEVALARCDGATFEDFTKDFLAAVIGLEFVPLGGVKDGGLKGSSRQLGRV